MGEAIVVRELHKRYGDVHAVAGADLVVNAGEVFALLGPNGAGKTTTVEILEGHRHRTAGEVRVLGFDPESRSREFRERIGIVLQNTGIDRELTLRELLHLYAPLYPNPRPVEEVLELVGMVDKAAARTKTLSGGQMRRADMALGLIGDPELLFLDEPTTGFDPSARRRAWEMIAGLRRLGKTILLTTHYMDEAQYLADRVAVMSHGRIVAEGPPEDLGPELSSQTRIQFLASERNLPALSGDVQDADGWITVTTAEPTRDLHALTSWALERQVELRELTVGRPDLEEIYLYLTGGEEGA